MKNGTPLLDTGSVVWVKAPLASVIGPIHRNVARDAKHVRFESEADRLVRDALSISVDQPARDYLGIAYTEVRLG